MSSCVYLKTFIRLVTSNSMIILVKFIKHNQKLSRKLDVSTSIRGLHQKKLVLRSTSSWHDEDTVSRNGHMYGSAGSCLHHSSWPVVLPFGCVWPLWSVWLCLLPDESKRPYTYERKDNWPWTVMRAATSWATHTTAFLTRCLPVVSRTGRTEYQLLLMKPSDRGRNVKF